MQKKFLSNLILIVVLNLLVKPFYILGIDAEVQNRVGEEVYGNYFSLLNFSFLLNILLDFGLTNYNTKNIAQYPKQVANHFGKILGLRFTLFFLYVAVTLAAGFVVGYNKGEYELLLWLMFNQFLVAIVQFARSNFAGLHLFKTDAFISVLDRSLLILICSSLLWTNWYGGELKIEWFIYAQTVAYGISALISTALLFIKIGTVNLRVKKAFSISILRRSFPYALLILLMMMYSRIDAVMLERMLPDGNVQAGLYAQGFRLLDAVNMFALLFAGLLLPIFARLIKEKQQIKSIVQLAFRLLLGISLIVGVICFVNQQALINLRYPGSPVEASVTFGWLILSFIPVSATYVFGTLLTANGSLKYLNWMAFGGVVLNVVLNYVLILNHQAVGAAFATLITQGVTALVQVFVAYRLFNFSFGVRYYLKFLVLIGVVLLFHFGLNELIETSALNLIVPVFVFSVLIGFALNIFAFRDFKQLLGKTSPIDLEGENHQE